MQIVKNTTLVILKEKKMGLEELGFAGIKLLITLHRLGRRTLLANLKRQAGTGSQSTYRALAVLFKYNLVKDHIEGPRRYLELTEKGKKIAELLEKAEEILVQE